MKSGQSETGQNLCIFISWRRERGHELLKLILFNFAVFAFHNDVMLLPCKLVGCFETSEVAETFPLKVCIAEEGFCEA